MNRLEHILTILMEECTELCHVTSKAQRFGLHEKRDLPELNSDRMQKELNDIMAVICLLNDEFDMDLHIDPDLIVQKQEKISEYLAYSAKCGTLTE